MLDRTSTLAFGASSASNAFSYGLTTNVDVGLVDECQFAASGSFGLAREGRASSQLRRTLLAQEMQIDSVENQLGLRRMAAHQFDILACYGVTGHDDSMQVVAVLTQPLR